MCIRDRCTPLFRCLFYRISSRLDFYSKALSGGQDKKNGGHTEKGAANLTAELNSLPLETLAVVLKAALRLNGRLVFP